MAEEEAFVKSKSLYSKERKFMFSLGDVIKKEDIIVDEVDVKQK
jgi:hypothetical protein